MVNKILLAQINPRVGDIDYNYKKIVSALRYSENNLSGLTIFPELALCGAPVLDIIHKYPSYAAESQDFILNLARQFNKSSFLCGFPEKVNDGSSLFYNSCACVSKGKVVKIVRKSLLSTHDEFFEHRSFVSFTFDPLDRLFTDSGLKYFIIFGEEIFDDSIINSAVSASPDYIICLCSFISRTYHNELINNRLKFLSTSNSFLIIFVNQIGATDSFVSYGGSRVFSNGSIVAQAKFFEEDFIVFDGINGTCDNASFLPDSFSFPSCEFSLDYSNDLPRVYMTVKTGIKDYFEKNGFKSAVLGLSGGLDSTVCAVLLADVLGPKNVIGVSMPSSITSSVSKNDAKELAKNLGILFYEIPIHQMTQASSVTFDTVFDKIEYDWQDRRIQGSLTFDNIQARSRAMILWGISNEFSSCLPIATCDKSELYMGYATINGDMSGSFAPLCDITKTKLFALADWLNSHSRFKNSIPLSVLEKPPGAELAINPDTGKPLTAEEALMPYTFLDEVIWRLEFLGQTFEQMIHEQFLYEKTKRLDSATKKMWLDKFKRRFSSATFKGVLMPSGAICDYKSINKSCSLIPITSKIFK